MIRYWNSHFSDKIIVIWLACLCIRFAMPFERGIKRFKTGPLSTVIFFTKSLSGAALKLFFALETAECKSFAKGCAVFFAVNFNDVSASFADFPRMVFATSLIFLGATLKYLRCALYSFIIIF